MRVISFLLCVVDQVLGGDEVFMRTMSLSRNMENRIHLSYTQQATLGSQACKRSNSPL